MVVTLTKLTSELADNIELYDMSKEEGDEASLLTIEGEAAKLAADVEQLEFRRMFNNPADPLNAFVDIQAGAGGTEACDWASMLLRQYLKYAERKGFKATVEDETPGDTAGIKSATIKVEGEYAFGLLRTETGVHRLVRKSPFDSSATPRSPRCSSTQKSTTRSRSRSTRPMCAPTPSARPALAVSTSTRPIRRYA